MTRWLISGLAAAAAAFVLAGCGGGGDDSSATPAPSSSGGRATTVSAKQLGDAGTVLVDTGGKALYASDVEMNGMVACTESCEAFWKPLTLASGTPSGSSLPGDLGVKQRPDGGRQVTYNGQLLYTFSEDQPGQVTGDGFSDTFDGTELTWHVVHAESADDSTGGDTGGGGLYG